MNYLAVGIGGIFGALFRYEIGAYASGIYYVNFPFGTLIANLAGCLLLSFIAYTSLLAWNLPRHYLLAINTGFVGSLTTFSTFSLDTLLLIKSGRVDLALLYVLVSLIGGFCLSFLGVHLALTLCGRKGEQSTSPN